MVAGDRAGRRPAGGAPPHTNHPGRPRWPAAVAVLAIGGIYLLVPERLSPGPRWLLLLVVAALLLPLNLARRRGYHDLTRRLALAVIGIVTAAVIASAGFLIVQLPGPGLSARVLLRETALIWVANVLTFAIWYWEIDAGGPGQRRAHHHTSPDFLFPQMTMDGMADAWVPNFLDYLFLAFNTSTAFSPTDTLALSHRVKLLMMLQSLISLVVIAVLAARAINTL